MTAVPDLGSTSESEQMYLITVGRAVEGGVDGPVSISSIADALRVSVSSANEMVRKLVARGLLTYEPYRGVQLTPPGARIADQVLRTRRLWATFLVEHLGFSPVDADTQACDLEHTTSSETAERLAAFLGNPEAGPLGRPIPKLVSSSPRRQLTNLSDIAVGSRAEVISLTAADRILDFLRAERIVVGAHLRVAAAGSTGLLVELDGEAVHIDDSIVATIAVRPLGGSDAQA